jgi:hypothetical protein
MLAEEVIAASFAISVTMRGVLRLDYREAAMSTSSFIDNKGKA